MFLNTQQMVPQTIREEIISATYWEVNRVPVPKNIAFVKNVINVVRGFVSYI